MRKTDKVNFLIGLFPVLLLGWSVPSVAQEGDSCTYVIQGIVYDLSTKAPLSFAAIQLDTFPIGTYADENGHFQLSNLCEKEHDLKVSYLGYKTAVHHHDFHHPFMEIFLATEETLLESVVVEAEYSHSNLQTATTSKIAGRDLEAVQSESFADAVSQITGVNTISTGQNIAKPIIHGLHSNRILLINNGLRHEFQNWGIDHAPELDLSSIDEIEVVKGAATVRFGPEALGGVILTNPSPLNLSTPSTIELSMTGKSNGKSIEGNSEWRKGWKWISLMAGGSVSKQGDLHAPDYNLSNTGKQEGSYFGGFRLHPLAELDIEGYLSKFDQTLGILTGSNFSNLEDLQRAIGAEQPFFTEPFRFNIEQPRQEVGHELYKAKARWTGDKQVFEMVYGYQINRRKEFGVRRGDDPNINLELATHSLDADWLHPEFGPLTGRIGIQLQKQANDNLPGTNTVPFIPNFDSKRIGFYLIENIKKDKNIYELGLRYDIFHADVTGREPDNTIYRNKIDYKNFTTTIGYKHEFDHEKSFRSNFGTAWRPPNIAELYRFGQHSFAIEYGLWRYTIDENFDFISTSQGILTEEDRPVPTEIGYKWINTFELHKAAWQIEGTAYINYIKNYIYAKPGGLTRTPRGYFVYFIYDQTDALFWGIDLTSRWQHSPTMLSTLKASYLWSKQIEEGDFFAGQPPTKLGYDFSFSPKWKSPQESEFRINLEYTFKQFQHPRILTVDEFLGANQNEFNRFAGDASDFDILPPPSGYLLINIAYQGSLKQLHWRLQIKNILNHSYRNYTDRLRYFADETGRNIVLTLSCKIK